jgi:hypothetical protein
MARGTRATTRVIPLESRDRPPRLAALRNRGPTFCTATSRATTMTRGGAKKGSPTSTSLEGLMRYCASRRREAREARTLSAQEPTPSIRNAQHCVRIARRWNFIFGGNTYYVWLREGLKSGYGRPPCLLQGQSRKATLSFARVAVRFIR